MAKRIERVIESRRWHNEATGATASPYGACPWVSEADRPNWTLETCGFTWEWSDGRVGLGCRPAKTRAEAEARMEQVNARMANPYT